MIERICGLKSLARRVAVLWLGICMCLQPVFLQSAWAQQNRADNNQEITLNLEDVDIKVLINMVAEVSGKNFVVDPRVKGKVSVVSGKPLDVNQLYEVFLSILEVNNYSTVESGQVTKIVPNNLVKQRPTPTVFSQSQNGAVAGLNAASDEQITQIIQLQYAPVQELVPILRPLIPATSHFAPHVPSNSLVITDTIANIQRILQIVKGIDVPDKRSNLRVVYLEHAGAAETASTIQGIFSQPQNSATPTDTPVSIQAADGINALIISASDDTYLKIKALIEELDIERALDPDVSVIYLKHARAPDLVPILNGTTGNSTSGNTSTVSVQADEATNSLVVKAKGAKFEELKSVIEKLDVRRAQVFVETVIAEVSVDQSANLGLNWQIGDAENPITLVDRQGRNEEFVGQVTSNTDFNLGSGGLNYSLLDFRRYRLDVIINALRSDVNSNILSTPTVLTLDNEEAEIVVGQEVPFVTGRFNNGLNNTNTTTDADGNTTTTSNANTFQTIERKDVGIKLKIKPQISEGNTIKLDVAQEISSVSTATVQGQADLITNRRSIDAVVQVDDGQVVVLGGLIQDDVIDTVESVPILGQIPIIGYLFRNTNKVAVKRNLMVFLKPQIVRTAGELTDFSRDKYQDIRREGIESKQLGSQDFLLGGSKQPILQEYDEVVQDGNLASEERNNKRALERAENARKETAIDESDGESFTTGEIFEDFFEDDRE